MQLNLESFEFCWNCIFRVSLSVVVYSQDIVTLHCTTQQTAYNSSVLSYDEILLSKHSPAQPEAAAANSPSKMDCLRRRSLLPAASDSSPGCCCSGSWSWTWRAVAGRRPGPGIATPPRPAGSSGCFPPGRDSAGPASGCPWCRGRPWDSQPGCWCSAGRECSPSRHSPPGSWSWRRGRWSDRLFSIAQDTCRPPS